MSTSSYDDSGMENCRDDSSFLSGGPSSCANSSSSSGNDMYRQPACPYPGPIASRPNPRPRKGRNVSNESVSSFGTSSYGGSSIFGGSSSGGGSSSFTYPGQGFPPGGYPPLPFRPVQPYPPDPFIDQFPIPEALTRGTLFRWLYRPYVNPYLE